ncbi:hypothetical protein IWZ03DRAFT_442177 [Phyllosticta citriasiana]|uniref:Zn(2)-C6 fungal-type domain-containing protein n=1 Tax=Phyllosticta citriasiana TaxID=595635 RepID=A0ABR1KKE3_9PEZI
MTTTTSTAKQSLRRSCRFCRARKIRCSGHGICDACRERDIDCVYDFEVPKPRAEPADPNNSTPSPLTSSSTPLSTTTVAADLEADFAASYPPPSAAGLSPSPRATREQLDYHDVLPVLVHDFVGLAAVKLGRLGCQHIINGGGSLCRRGIAEDTTETMFDQPPIDPPLARYEVGSGRRSSQMIDIWFSMHPLTVIVSKTLLLRGPKTKPIDEALLAVILGDAELAQEDENARECGRQLLAWAAHQLRSRPSSTIDLSTVQLLLILAWHELCRGSLRRAACYVRYAGRMMATVKDSAPDTHSRINGISVADIEAELLAYAWWTTFALSLWSFMQDDRPFLPLLHSFLPPSFLPTEGSASVSIKLDIASENLSTLPSQRRMVRQIWSLSHIASAVAHAYASWPQTAENLNGVAISANWQERSLHQFRRLLRFSQNQEAAEVCNTARRVFSDCIALFQEQSSNHVTSAVVLTSFYILLIHFVFPRNAKEDSSPEISDPVEIHQMLRDFLSFADALLSLMEKSNQIDFAGSKAGYHSCLAGLHLQAVDACSRGFEFFSCSAQSGSFHVTKTITSHAEGLYRVATQVKRFAQDKVEAPAKSLRPVMKRLKASRAFFCGCSKRDRVEIEQQQPGQTGGEWVPTPVITPNGSDDSSSSEESSTTPIIRSRKRSPVQGLSRSPKRKMAEFLANSWDSIGYIASGCGSPLLQGLEDAPMMPNMSHFPLRKRRSTPVDGPEPVALNGNGDFCLSQTYCNAASQPVIATSAGMTTPSLTPNSNPASGSSFGFFDPAAGTKDFDVPSLYLGTSEADFAATLLASEPQTTPVSLCSASLSSASVTSPPNDYFGATATGPGNTAWDFQKRRWPRYDDLFFGD